MGGSEDLTTNDSEVHVHMLAGIRINNFPFIKMRFSVIVSFVFINFGNTMEDEERKSRKDELKRASGIEKTHF